MAGMRKAKRSHPDDDDVTRTSSPTKRRKAFPPSKFSSLASLLPNPKNKHFPFLSLAGELRNQIYGYILEDEKYVYSCAGRCLPRRNNPAGGFFLPHPARQALPAINRQIRSEVASLIYADHLEFHITTAKFFRSFRNIGAMGLEHIKHLTFAWRHLDEVQPWGTTSTVGDVLKLFTGLKSIEIVIGDVVDMTVPVAFKWPGTKHSTHSPTLASHVDAREFVALHGLKEMRKAGVEVEITPAREWWDYGGKKWRVTKSSIDDETWRRQVVAVMEEASD